MPRPWPVTAPSAEDRAAYANAAPRPYWGDALAPREASPALTGRIRADLCIVGGGFTGLWAALHAKAERPERDVVLVEAERIGGAASGRNGGFCVASLTHGIANGLARFPGEMAALERLGLENYAGLLADLGAHGIDCDLEESGELTVALEPHQIAWLEEEAELLQRFGHDVTLLGEAAMQGEVASPTFLGGVWDRTGAAILDPAKLALGLRDAAEAAGVRIFERSRVATVERSGKRGDPAGVGGVRVRVQPSGSDGTHHAIDSTAPGGPLRAGIVDADRVLLATGAHPSPVRSVRARIAPVYDYVLMTEPLSPAQQASIGWSGRQGIGDSANQFHYYRPTVDGRILWGGYDAVYRHGGPVDARFDEHEASFARLSQHFFTTFPQLRGLRFSHRWGGAIDTCSRFSVFFGTTHGGRVAYAAGYTGLGVCASRFGGRVALDLLDGRVTEATRSKYVRSKPIPFPPEPLRSAAIALTRNRLEAADAKGGQRGAWLRTLDRLGVGFDS